MIHQLNMEYDSTLQGAMVFTIFAGSLLHLVHERGIHHEAQGKRLALKLRHKLEVLRQEQTGEADQNLYYLVRHGQSEANVKGIISSEPSFGLYNHGLTPEGIKQARAAAEAISRSLRQTIKDKKCYIVSSDFRRAKETADIIAKYADISLDNCTLSKDLRERSFGIYYALQMIVKNSIQAHLMAQPTKTMVNVVYVVF